MICKICGKEFKKGEVATVRTAWLRAGGFGTVPPEARVHPHCDTREAAGLKSGKIKLSDIYEVKG